MFRNDVRGFLTVFLFMTQMYVCIRHFISWASPICYWGSEENWNSIVLNTQQLLSLSLSNSLLYVWPVLIVFSCARHKIVLICSCQWHCSVHSWNMEENQHKAARASRDKGKVNRHCIDLHHIPSCKFHSPIVPKLNKTKQIMTATTSNLLIQRHTERWYTRLPLCEPHADEF